MSPPPPKFKPKSPASVIAVVAVNSVPTNPASLRFEINKTREGHHHWVLVRPSDKAVLAGHCGPNATTRAGAVNMIEKFKLMVANAVIAQQEKE